MPKSSQPLIELLRNTPPPPMTSVQEPVRSIPPPPMRPPPLTILKMVPPPPLPCHLSRICSPPALQVPVSQIMTNSTCVATILQRPSKGSMETSLQESPGTQAKRGACKTGRLDHSRSMGGRSHDDADSLIGRSREDADSFTGRSRDAKEGGDGSTSAEDAELVLVLKHLVNLFTMTSQVKMALTRVRSEGAGIQHQVSRTRSLVDSFREQLARRAVMLGRLIPPGTTGKPEIPRELRSKDPAGGDVSPQSEPSSVLCCSSSSSSSPPDGRARPDLSSLQALVPGDPEPATSSGARRWGSRVKRRFLAAARPARRVTERLKAPHASGPWTTPPGCVEALPSATVGGQESSSSASSSGGSSEEDGRRYFSPGCYVIDGAGLPREAAPATREAESATREACCSEAETGTAGSGPAAIFGVPLSVLMSEASKKNKKHQPAVVGGPGRGDDRASSPGVQRARRDRSWRTAGGPLQPPPPQEDRGQLSSVLAKLRIEDEDFPSVAAAAADRESQSPDITQQELNSKTDDKRFEDAAEARDGTAGGTGRGSEATRVVAGGEGEEEEEEEEEGWMSRSFDEDWFLSTEREEEERRRREEEGKRDEEYKMQAGEEQMREEQRKAKEKEEERERWEREEEEQFWHWREQQEREERGDQERRDAEYQEFLEG